MSRKLTQRALLAIAEAEDLMADVREAFKDDAKGGERMNKNRGKKGGGKGKGK